MMIMPRGVSRWFVQTGVLASALVLFACTEIMAQDPYVNMKVEDVIRKSVVTVSVLPDNQVFLITPDGKVLDAMKVPLLRLPSDIGKGENITTSTTAVFAVLSSNPHLIEVRGNFGFGPVCYVYNRHTGAYMGSCPKEKYP